MKLLAKTNSKLKKDGIWSFGIPAGKACPYAGACAAFCYAKKGFYVFGNVKDSQQRRFEATKCADFQSVIGAELKKAKRIRIHDSGDFYSVSYRDKWLAIAAANPSVEFYAYTKSVRFFLGNARGDLIDLPKNFRIIFSYGGKEDHLIDPTKHRHAKIFGSKAELDAAGYVDSSERDLPAATSDSLKIGLIYH